MSKMEKKKNQKNAKNRASFLPSPVPPLNKGTLNLQKITEHLAERVPDILSQIESISIMRIVYST